MNCCTLSTAIALLYRLSVVGHDGQNVSRCLVVGIGPALHKVGTHKRISKVDLAHGLVAGVIEVGVKRQGEGYRVVLHLAERLLERCDTVTPACVATTVESQ